MFDAIKKLAGRFLENTAAYMRHAGAIEHILSLPTEPIAVNALRNYVFSLNGEADFQHFKAAIFQQYQLTLQSQSQAGAAWGSSTEDRIAYQQAHLIAGQPTGGMIAQQRLYYLQAMNQYADLFWMEARQARAAVPPAPPAVPG